MRATCRRVRDGQAIREAMDERGLSLMALADRTKELDPEGLGVSFRLIGFLTTQGRSQRETTSPESAALIAQALNVPEVSLFTRENFAMNGTSTDKGKLIDAS